MDFHKITAPSDRVFDCRRSFAGGKEGRQAGRPAINAYNYSFCAAWPCPDNESILGGYKEQRFIHALADDRLSECIKLSYILEMTGAASRNAASP